MKKPVGRLLYPNTGWYFAAMLLFTAAAAAVGQYILAGGALFVTLIMFIISRARLSRRKRQLMSYVQTATDSVGISVHAGSAFPMAVIRLPENEIIWGNPSFFTITGLSDTACYQTLDAVVPGFSTSWLREGRSELPGDQIIGDRRYRIYGNYVKSEDDATTVQLATIYFADMTEMFNVRDEFLRTRPIVSIILIDNYDELTANLSDSAISTLDAQLNDVVANWTAGLEALCRKIERNRYLLIFESKDLARLQDGRFSILEDVRHVTTSGGMSATISLGIGKDGGSFAENYRFASLAIEMSLSRGGDQAVIKDRFNFTFYGGRTKEAERHTRVKLGRLDGDGGGIDDLRGIVGNGIVRLGRFGGAAARLRRGDGVVGEFLRRGGLFHGHFRGGSLRFGIVGCAGGLWGGVCRHGVGACRAAGENGQGQQGGEKDGKDRSLFHVEFPFLMCFCFYRRIFAQLVAGNGKFF